METNCKAPEFIEPSMAHRLENENLQQNSMDPLKVQTIAIKEEQTIEIKEEVQDLE